MNSQRSLPSIPTFMTTTALVLMALWLTATVAMAQDSPKPTDGDTSNVVGFKAVDADNAPKENLPGWPFLYGAYFVLWLIPLAYLLVMWRRQSALDGRLQSLDRRLDNLDTALDAKAPKSKGGGDGA
ncbi:MAG: hypothetical protein AAFS10_13520 [Myxococcota bacterium]